MINEEKEELLEYIQDVLGAVPENARQVIKILGHPHLIKHTQRYFQALDMNGRCLKYESPWNCAREAEAHYENIKFGWLGGVGGIGYNDNWCEPCRRRVMELQ